MGPFRQRKSVSQGQRGDAWEVQSCWSSVSSGGGEGAEVRIHFGTTGARSGCGFYSEVSRKALGGG